MLFLMRKKKSELKKIEMNFRDLESKRNELESDLTESDYFLNMKNKEIDVLVSEKGDLIDSLKAKTKQIDIQSTNLKENREEILRLNQNILNLNQKLSQLSFLLQKLKRGRKKD